MDYTSLRPLPDDERIRIINGLSSLRTGLNAVPAKGPKNFLLATWNIREFGGTKFSRVTDAFYYIAECINRFDLVAVQEVRQDLVALKQVMRILGKDWGYIFSDVSFADGGNGERLAFVYDRSRVHFTGLAGELVLPSKSATELMSQISRTPLLCGFQAGWAKFNLCTVHIYYGKAKREDPKRVDEINAAARFLAEKAKSYINIVDPIAYSPENLVLLGDFNIFDRTDATFDALTKNKFVVPEQLLKLKGSNALETKFYDQIAFFKETRGIAIKDAGIFNFYKYVFNDAKVFSGTNLVPARTPFDTWRTFQMSDHLIMWTEFDVDKTDTYLKSLLRVEAATEKTTRTSGKKKAATPKISRSKTPNRRTPSRKTSSRKTAGKAPRR